MLGQCIEPEQYHRVVDVVDDAELDMFLKKIKANVDSTVAQLPAHHVYVDQYSKDEKL